MSNILVIAEHVDKTLRNVTLSTLNFAKQAAELTGGQVHVLVLGDGVESIGKKIAEGGYGAHVVHVANGAQFSRYLAENYTPAVAQVAKQLNATIVCAPSSTFGKDLLPRVAATLDAGMVSDAITVSKQGEELRFKRPLWADNVITTVEVTTPIKVVSVRATAFEALEGQGQAELKTLQLTTPVSDSAKFVSFEQVKSDRPELTDAQVIVAGGRGLKSAENFGMLENLADLLGGAVGASRAAADSGYAPNDWQIGQTGKVVAPNLYFAVAISGAIQHLAGMKGSKTIVAINKDADAPIFQVADYGLVGDAFTLVPELTQKLKAAGFGV